MAAIANKTFSFDVILSDVDVTADVIHKTGCHDATPSSSQGVVTIHFDRESESLGDAIGSAVKNVERAGLKIARINVEPLRSKAFNANASLAESGPYNGKPRGIGAVLGQWPGDETDEEIEAAIQEIS